jgi:diguanylate cyclase (GGDEF)-like protein
MCTISVVAKEMVKLLDEYTYADYSGKTEGSEDRTSEYARIWDNIIKSSHSKYFWKDKERRFRGVSRAFLDFYEIKSLDDIIGKTDEDMHWHLDDVPYKDDELDVINKGAVVFNARGQCIVNGVVHNIICNKMPLYDKGEIVGLIGSFDDVDQELYRVQKLVNPSRVDNVTRLMNNRFFLEAMVDYAAQYNDAGRNYGIIIIHNSNHKRIVTDYGEKFANKVLREMGEKIIECIGQTAAAARNKEAYFGVIIYIKTREELIELGEKIKAAVLEIHEVDSKSVTLRVSMGVSHRSDEGIKDETMYQVALEEVERIEKEEKHKKG